MYLNCFDRGKKTHPFCNTSQECYSDPGNYIATHLGDSVRRIEKGNIGKFIYADLEELQMKRGMPIARKNLLEKQVILLLPRSAVNGCSALDTLSIPNLCWTYLMLGRKMFPVKKYICFIIITVVKEKISIEIKKLGIYTRLSYWTTYHSNYVEQIQEYNKIYSFEHLEKSGLKL